MNSPRYHAPALLLLVCGCPSAKDLGEGTSETTCAMGGENTTWYGDGDGDGAGDLSSPIEACDQPEGTVGDASDCDDSNAAVYPGATEQCGDGVVNDCNDSDGTAAAKACSRKGTFDQNDADVKLLGQEGDHAGNAVARAGDVNGDGKDDLFIGAVGAGEGGAAYLVLGAPSGDTPLAYAEAHLHAESEGDYIGFALSGAGDVDGDGFFDLLLGAYGHSVGGIPAGAAYLVSGPVTGELGLAHADAKFFGEKESDNAGLALTGPGDVDGDGVDDLLIGAPAAQVSEDVRAGKAYLVLGPVTGEHSLADADATFGAENVGDTAGSDVARCGDLDGDGMFDLFVGASGYAELSRDAGAAYLAFGPVSGDLSLGDADGKMVGEVPGHKAGALLAGARDVNGDGTPDLLIGAPDTADNYTPAIAYLVLGPGTGYRSLDGADASFVKGGYSIIYSMNIASYVGDLDIDGYADLLFGVPDADTGATDGGAAYLIHGPATGAHELEEADASFYDNEAESRVGYSVAGAGDVDGDGLPDLLIGAFGDDDAARDAGAAYLLLGSGSILSGLLGP